MRITVDMSLCASHGQCVFTAPEVFSFDDEDYLVYDVSPDGALRQKVRRAAAACPVRAVTVAAGSGPG